jgi:PRTRC genetic system ThiF family protein
MTKLDLSYLKAGEFLVPSWERGGVVVLVGVGGTGSWLAPDVVRILKRVNNPGIRFTLVDPDTVEARNVERQNFCEAEVGRNKAETMAERLTHAYGLDIAAMPVEFSKDMLAGLRHMEIALVLGCVDNAAARRTIHAALATVQSPEHFWWLDCGNHASSGQVCLGNHTVNSKRYPFPAKCSVFPAPTVQHPELLVDANEPGPTTCAEITDPQGLTVNRMVAAIAGDYVMRLLTGTPIKRYASYFDLASMSVQSLYIPPSLPKDKR